MTLCLLFSFGVLLKELVDDNSMLFKKNSTWRLMVIIHSDYRLNTSDYAEDNLGQATYHINDWQNHVSALQRSGYQSKEQILQKFEHDNTHSHGIIASIHWILLRVIFFYGLQWMLISKRCYQCSHDKKWRTAKKD